MGNQFMNDVFIWEGSGGKVNVTRVVKGGNLPNESDDDYVKRTLLKIGVPSGDPSRCKKASLAEADALDRSNRHQWRWDVSKKNGIKIDASIKSKREIIAEAENELAAELEKPNSDAVSVIRAQRKLDAARKIKE